MKIPLPEFFDGLIWQFGVSSMLSHVIPCFIILIVITPLSVDSPFGRGCGYVSVQFCLLLPNAPGCSQAKPNFMLISVLGI